MDDMKSVKSPLEQAGFSPSVEAADYPPTMECYGIFMLSVIYLDKNCMYNLPVIKG